MDQFNKQTATRSTEAAGQTAQRIIGSLFGIVEILLIFRLAFKALGANPGNAFVSGIYWITGSVVGLFEGIFPQSNTGGVDNAGVLEPATLIAIIVTALLAWILLKVMTPRKTGRVEQTMQSEHSDRTGRSDQSDHVDSSR